MSPPASLWLSRNPSKRWTEIFFLAYSPFWIVWALCILVPFQLYEYCNEVGYMAIGLAAAVPCFTLPLMLRCKADEDKPWTQWFWVKANVWIAIFSFIGNYFWTHYFYQLLGAAYTMPSWRLNDVPIPLYLMTHAYFCFYHALANVVLRRLWHAMAFAGKRVQWVVVAAAVVALSYATAYGETLTIAHFPYYTFVDRDKMYSVGSVFYALYFIVSFPMFLRLDEQPSKRSSWSLCACALDSLAAGMLVTIALDLWRLIIGPIVHVGKQDGLPWMLTPPS